MRITKDNIKMDLQEVGWGAWTGLIWLGCGEVAGSCERSNEPLGFGKCKEFLYQLRTSLFPMKDSSPWS